jgi:hypothetical protein
MFDSRYMTGLRSLLARMVTPVAPEPVPGLSGWRRSA